jgi:hypothetical protein
MELYFYLRQEMGLRWKLLPLQEVVFVFECWRPRLTFSIDLVDLKT